MVNTKPYMDKCLGGLEYFNEVTLLLCAYMLPSFTGLITNLNDNYKFGWVFVYILAPLFIVNISFILIQSVIYTIRVGKQCRRVNVYEKSDHYIRTRRVKKMMAQKGQWEELAPPKLVGEKN